MEKRTERINMKVLPSLKAKAQEMAEKDGRTLSNFIEVLITEAYDARKRDDKDRV